MGRPIHRSNGRSPRRALSNRGRLPPCLLQAREAKGGRAWLPSEELGHRTLGYCYCSDRARIGGTARRNNYAEATASKASEGHVFMVFRPQTLKNAEDLESLACTDSATGVRCCTEYYLTARIELSACRE